MEENYKKCSEFYCEDPKRQQSDEIGKKIMGCLYFICKTEETLNQLEIAKKKEEDRKATKNNLSFKNKPSNESPTKINDVEKPVAQ